tara:strand:- start:18 stop:233 length:216 start_codon:yes stop_codon:yes gene_type:complete
MNKIKWASSLILSCGLVLTSFNIYPFNLYVQFFGVLGWLVVGVKTKDNALVFVNSVGLAILSFGIIYSQSL